MSDGTPGFRGRARLVLRVAQVRLRLVIVLAAACLVIGQWDTLRNWASAFRHKLAGSSPANHGVSGETEYFCPMDPGVLSDWPAICPICNMDLVRRKWGDVVILPDGVIARMRFSPYRIQLAGIKTAVVTQRPLAREITLAGRFVETSWEEPRLVLECRVYDDDVPFLSPGRTVQLTVAAIPSHEPFVGTIERPAPSAIAAHARHGSVIWIQPSAEDRRLQPGLYATARVEVPLTEIEPFKSQAAGAETTPPAGMLAVPETAVVDYGSRQVVYVETMPGMFDGVEVTVGPRCGDSIPVFKGLAAGQKVAAVGVFLIDAEARLNPHLAAAYFGASRSKAPPAGEAPAASAPLPKAGSSQQTGSTRPGSLSKLTLSPADQALAAKQRTCPVTDLPLASMGGPLPVEIAGQKVFICCKGCEAKLKQDPRKYLAKLKVK